jgi:hypothetical protein
MLTKIKQFVKTYQTDIILVIGVILISLLSFAMGYIVAKQQEKENLKFEEVVEEDSFFSTFAEVVEEDSFFSIFAFPSDSEAERKFHFLSYLRFLWKLGV